MVFKGMKIRINSPEHSEKVQKALFALGYHWNNGSVVQYQDENHLYAEESGCMSFSSDDELFFRESSEQEVELVEETKYSFVPVATPSQEEAPAQIPVKEK